MADLTTKYLGLTLKNPLIVGSSGLTAKLDSLKIISDLGAGAVVLKSIFEEQILFETQKELENVDVHVHTEATDYLNRMTKEHSIYQYLKLIEGAKKAVPIPVLASVHCLSDGDWINFSKKIELAGADALELNILITEFAGKTSAEIENVYFNIIEKVKSSVKIPVAIKIGAYFSNLPNMIIKLSKSGVDGLVLFNRYWSPNVDLKKMEIISGNVFSHPDELTTPLRWIGLVSDQVDCDICGSTGVHDGESALKLISVGATAVQVCSALYKKGLEHVSVILAQIETWMKEHNYKSIGEIRGKLKPTNAEQRKIFGRAQFMKYYASLE